MHCGSLLSWGPGNNIVFLEYTFHVLILLLFLIFALFSENDTVQLDIDPVLNIEDDDNEDFEFSIIVSEDDNLSSDYVSIDINAETHNDVLDDV